jgi:hypothetical protein
MAQAGSKPSLLVVGRFLQQNASHKGSGSGQQPFDAPHLDCLELGQVRGVIKETHAERSSDAAQPHDESDQGSRWQTDPALDFVEMQIV